MVTSILGIVICRVGAVLLFVQGAEGLQFVLPALLEFHGNPAVSLSWLVLATGIPVGAGLALWFLAERICRARIESARIEISSSLDALDLVGIGTLLIGVYALLFGFVGAVSAEAAIWGQKLQQQDHPRIQGSAAWSYASMRVSYAAQILLGLLLIAGRQRLARLLLGIRFLGTGRLR